MPYKFAYARADDLQIGDVPELLGGYKSLALQYEALCRGAAALLEDVKEGDGEARRSRNEKGAGGRREAAPPAAVADVDGLATFAPGPPAVPSPACAAGAEDPFAGLAVGGASDATSTKDSTFTGP